MRVSGRALIRAADNLADFKDAVTETLVPAGMLLYSPVVYSDNFTPAGKR